MSYRYQSAFAKFGVKGIDLLGANENILRDLGIDRPVHLNRAKIAVDQLLVYQNGVDLKEKENALLYEREKNYHDLKEECKRLESLSPAYVLPKKIDYWKPVDVMLWLNVPQNTTYLGIFVKPFALSRINGPELLQMVVVPKDDQVMIKNVLDVVSRFLTYTVTISASLLLLFPYCSVSTVQFNDRKRKTKFSRYPTLERSS